MSGHSKWSKVKHQKATTDVLRAQNFTRASRAITVAVKEGGGISDPNTNFRLRLAIEKAREVNMPKENIERAIAKAKGEGSDSIESLLYEAYGPHGVPVLIEATTENRQRTVSQVKNVIDRNGGVLASQGAVVYQFIHRGLLIIELINLTDKDDLFSLALEAGAEDVNFFNDHVEIYTKIQELEKIKLLIEQKGIIITSSELVYYPTMAAEYDNTQMSNIRSFIDKLEELEDVQRVYTNLSE